MAEVTASTLDSHVHFHLFTPEHIPVRLARIEYGAERAVHVVEPRNYAVVGDVVELVRPGGQLIYLAVFIHCAETAAWELRCARRDGRVRQGRDGGHCRWCFLCWIFAGEHGCCGRSRHFMLVLLWAVVAVVALGSRDLKAGGLARAARPHIALGIAVPEHHAYAAGLEDSDTGHAPALVEVVVEAVCGHFEGALLQVVVVQATHRRSCRGNVVVGIDGPDYLRRFIVRVFATGIDSAEVIRLLTAEAVVALGTFNFLTGKLSGAAGPHGITLGIAVSELSGSVIVR
jgi:hypothetical protein